MKNNKILGLLLILFGVTLSACGGNSSISDDSSLSGSEIKSDSDSSSSNSESESSSIHEHEDKNNDHMCDGCGERLSYCQDNNIDGTCDICEKSWSNNTKALFNETIGELLPYFESNNGFELTQYGYIEALVNGDARNAIESCFTSTNKYSCEETEYLGSPALLLLKVCDKNELSSVRVYVIYNSGTDVTYVDVDLTTTEVSNFPIELVNQYLNGKPLCDVIVPDDGTIFSYEEDEYCCTVYTNCDGYDYLQKVIDADYVIDASMMEYYPFSYTFRAISSDRSLAMEIDISQLENTNVTCTLKFSAPDIPNETAWPENTQKLMMDLFGELLPFANAGFVFDDDDNEESSKYHNYMMGSSYNIDAFYYMVNAFKAREDYAWTYEEDGNFYTFTKDCNTYLIVVVVGVYESETVVTAERKIPTSTTWPIERILKCFDIEITDEIPAATGNLFKVYYEEAHPNIAIVTVMGSKQDLDNYIQTLNDAEYKVTSDPISDYAATAPNRSVIMYITDYTDKTGQDADYEPFFTIEIQAHEPSPVGAIFPLDEVNAELGDATYNGPVPTGTSFVTSYPYGKGTGACDIMVSIAGGDKEAFIAAIIEAGYAYDVDYSYKDYDAYSNPSEHIIIYVYKAGTNSDYDIEFGLYFDAVR